VTRAFIYSSLALAIVGWLAVPPGLMPTFASADEPDAEAARARLAALKRARVLAGPRADRKGGTTPANEIRCRYLYTKPSGTTPKFDCLSNDGERLRVKYGSREVGAEVAAMNFLDDLGFGADDLSMVQRVRCYGCPRWPFLSRQVADKLRFDKFLEQHVDYGHYVDFEWVSVKWRDQHDELEFGPEEGWAWHELPVISPAAGGASRAEVDALRLVAMFLNHWDNKMSNQGLVCAPDCGHPLAMIEDAGSTFGPKKLNLEAWSQSSFWADEARCIISMKQLPYNGGTFPDATISEAGRRLLADRLARMTTARIQQVFAGARFDDVDRWVAAFERRAGAIARRPPCPAMP
jgi:hypothetical protein